MGKILQIIVAILSLAQLGYAAAVGAGYAPGKVVIIVVAVVAAVAGGLRSGVFGPLPESSQPPAGPTVRP
jgi:hypothetical protein